MSNIEKKTEIRKSKLVFWNYLAMVLSGIALGWMTGMSVTPAIQNIILSFLVVLVTVMGLVAGFTLKAKMSLSEGVSLDTDTDQSKGIEKYFENIPLLPLGLLMFFLAIGSATGILFRTNNILGANPLIVSAILGIDASGSPEYEKQAFDQLKRTMSDNSPASIPILYDGELDLCSQKGFVLRSILENIKEEDNVYQILIKDAADSTLIKVRDEYCPK